MRYHRATPLGRFRSGATYRPEITDLLNFLPAPDVEIATGVSLTSTKGLPLTFTRAGAKHCDKADGSVGLVATGKPCVGPRGLLVEPAITNLLSRSQELSTSPWLTQSGGTEGAPAPTLTANAGVAPDGTSTAEQVDYPAIVGSGQISIIIRTDSVSSGTTYTLSLWAKGVSGPGTIYLSVFDTQWNTVAINYTQTWQRFSLTRTASSTEFALLLGLDTRDAAQSGKPAQSVHLWGAQLETGDIARSYVPTTTVPVTCAKDTAVISGLVVPARARVSLQATPRTNLADGVNYHALFDTRTAGLSGAALYITPGGDLVASFTDTDSATTIAASPVWVAGQTYDVGVSWDGAGNAALIRDGIVLASGASQDLPGAGARFQIGALYDAGLPFDGWIRSLRVTL